MKYTYRAIVVRVKDGDTLVVDIDYGMDLWLRDVELRLYGINTPETDTPEGQAAKAHVTALLPPGTEVVLETIKNRGGRERTEKYGRYLAVIRVTGMTVTVNQSLLDLGMAKIAPWK